MKWPCALHQYIHYRLDAAALTWNGLPVNAITRECTLSVGACSTNDMLPLLLLIK